MKQKILSIASGIFGLAMSSQAALVAHYKFDETEGSTAVNSVTGNDDGEIFGGVTVGQTGVAGGAYLFNDSSGFVDVGNANFFSAITTSGQITLSAWINTTATTGGRNVVVFAGNSAASDRYLDLGYSGVGDATSGIPAGGAYGRNRASGNGVNTFSPAVNDGEWHHLVMSIDLNAASNQLNLFVDGSLVGSQTLSGAHLAFPTLNNFEIGRLGRSSPTDYFGGLIDDVQVYSSALNASEVAWLYNHAGQAIPEPGALGLAGLGFLALFRRKRA